MLGAGLVVLYGVFWLIKTHRSAQGLSSSDRLSILSVGIGWLLIGLGLLMVAISEGMGVASRIGVMLLIAGVCIRIFFNIFHR